MGRRAWVVGLLLVVASVRSAAGARSPLPEFAGPDRHLYVSGIKDSYDSVESTLKSQSSAVGAQYIVAVVNIADRGGVGAVGDGYDNAAQDFGDDLYDKWVAAGALERGLDPRRHVLITHAIGNRSVGIHWGSDWQALGFTGEQGAQVIDRSDFVLHARAGMFADANLALAARIESELAAALTAKREAHDRAEKGLIAGRRELAVGRPLVRHGEARAELERAATVLAAAEKTLTAGDPARAEHEVVRANDAIQAALRLDRSLQRRHVLLTRTLPLVAGGVVLAGLLLALVLALRRRRRAQQEWDALWADWRRRLDQAQVRLIELEETHAIFFRSTVDLSSKLVGKSLERYRELGEVVDSLTLGFDAATDLGKSAEARSKTDLPWRSAGLREAARLLERGEAVLSTKAKHDRRKLFLPADRIERVPVARLLDLLDDRYGRAVDRLDKLHADWRAAPEATQALARAIDAVDAAGAEIEGRGLPMAPYQAERARLGQERSQAEGLLPTDFLAARVRADEARVAAEALAERLGQLATMAGVLADEVMAGIERLTAKLPELRAQGLRVSEPIFDPDASLADARRRAQLAGERLEAGDVAVAREVLDDARQQVADTTARVELTEKLHSDLPRQLAERRALIAELRGGATLGQRQLDEFAARYARSSFAVEADNLEECAALFEQIETLVQGAEGDGAPSAQRLLAAAEKLERAGNGLQAIKQLLEDIERRRGEIEAAAAHAASELSRARITRQRAHGLAQANAHAVSAETAAVLESSEPLLAELGAAVAADKPDWFVLDRRSSELAGTLADAEVAAQREITAHAAAVAEMAAAEAELGRVRTELAASSEDRAAANARLGAADQELARGQQLIATPRADWDLALATARSAAALGGSARELAARDVQAAQAARVAIAAADELLGRHARYYGLNISVELGEAKGLIAAAKQELGAQAYEGALHSAEKASASAEAARRIAQAAVERAEAAQRAALAARAAAYRPTWSGSSSGRSSGSRSSGSSGFSWKSSATSSSSSRSSSSSSRGYSSGSSGRSYGSGSSGRGY